jgi:hypothetical protein
LSSRREFVTLEKEHVLQSFYNFPENIIDIQTKVTRQGRRETRKIVNKDKGRLTITANPLLD